MEAKTYSNKNLLIGRYISFIIFFLLIAYLITTAFGFLSLDSQEEQISGFYFFVMEILIILTAPLLIIYMVIVHLHCPDSHRIYSLTAIIFMAIMSSITSVVHFSILTLGYHFESGGYEWYPYFFSFRWPSVAYALDILAWDWFFALSLYFAAPVFNVGKLGKAIRILMILSASLSLVGLLGIPFNNMQVRNIGIVGYGIVAPVVFFLTGRYYQKLSVRLG